MDWFRRADVLVLALMLVYVLAVLTHTFWQSLFSRNKDAKQLASLRLRARNLRLISLVAPYLGSAGAFVGAILALYGFPGGNMEKYTFLQLLGGGIARALILTAVGILVTVPATCAYNCLCVRVALIEREESAGFEEMHRGSFRPSETLPLKKPFSPPPAFALIAALVLSTLVAIFTPYFDPPRAKGLALDLVSDRCEHDGDDRLIVLHVTSGNKVFLNFEEENWRSLAGRLSEIYSMRKYRTLYLVVDNDLPFQTVADAIDIAENTQNMTKAEPLDIRVRLITPAAMQSRCLLHPVAARPQL